LVFLASSTPNFLWLICVQANVSIAIISRML